MYQEKYFHCYPESDRGVRAKTSDGEIIMDLKTTVVKVKDSIRIEIFSVDTTGTKLITTREYFGVDQEEIEQFPSKKALDKIFGGRTRAVANSYPILSNIASMTLEEYYEYVVENMGVYI